MSSRNATSGKEQYPPKTGEPFYGGHEQIWIDGTETDGPLVVELGFHPVLPPSYAIRSKDLGVVNTGKPIKPPPDYPDDPKARYTFTEGETMLINAEMFDHRTGTGLIADAWMEDPVYKIGTGSTLNSCYELLERIIRRMILHVDPVTKELRCIFHRLEKSESYVFRSLFEP
ncbi:MAG: hypothetical protein Q9219_005873 [cf. Caloplaca sp. 3 TL-2023]